MSLNGIKDDIVKARSNLGHFSVAGYDSREIQHALTKLDEAAFWIERSMQIHGDQGMSQADSIPTAPPD